MREVSSSLQVQQKPLPTVPTVEDRLEGLSWKQARSGKCDYAKDAPDDLVTAVRAAKGGLKHGANHYTASTTDTTLFRFGGSKT